MGCSSGQIARGKLVLQTGSRLVRLLRSAHFARGASLFARQHSSRQSSGLAQSLPCQYRRPHKWGCRLSTSCQLVASSPRSAAVETAEKKSSKQQGQLISLPTTDESPQLDRIRHSVSTCLPAGAAIPRTAKQCGIVLALQFIT